jgi:hypothetical protein
MLRREWTKIKMVNSGSVQAERKELEKREERKRRGRRMERPNGILLPSGHQAS